jgi:hypothetical protein
MIILLCLLSFAGGFLFGGIVMACFVAGAVGAMFSATRAWSSPVGTSANPENAPPERGKARRESPTGLRLVARVGPDHLTPRESPARRRASLPASGQG